MFISNNYITDNRSPARILSLLMLMLCFGQMLHPPPIYQSQSQ